MDGKNFLTIVGAPEEMLRICKNIWRNNEAEVLDEDKKKELELVFQQMAQNGLRVVACAINPDVARSINPDALPPLAFVGFLA